MSNEINAGSPALERILSGINNQRSQNEISQELGVATWDEVLSMISDNEKKVLSAIARSGVSDEATRIWKVKEASETRRMVQERIIKEFESSVDQYGIVQKIGDSDFRDSLNGTRLLEVLDPIKRSIHALQEYTKSGDNYLNPKQDEVWRTFGEALLDIELIIRIILDKVGSTLKTRLEVFTQDKDFYIELIDIYERVYGFIKKNNLYLSNFSKTKLTLEDATNIEQARIKLENANS